MCVYANNIQEVYQMSASPQVPLIDQPRSWSAIRVGASRDARWDFDPHDVPSYRTPTHCHNESTRFESADRLEVHAARLRSR
jgi:hypothetical protein